MNKWLTIIANNLYSGKTKAKILIFFIVNILIISGGYLVYKTGGTKLSYLHFLYIPVIFAGFSYGVAIGTLCGIVVGIVLGPFMPESVPEQIYQPTEAWIFRTLFFVIVGLFAGLASQLTRTYLKFIEQKYLIDTVTNLPNYKGLEKLCANNNIGDGIFGICLLKLKNIKNVEKAFGPELTDYVTKKLATRIQSLIAPNSLLAKISNDAFLITAHKDNSVNNLALNLQQHLDRSFIIDSIPLYIETYCGTTDCHNLTKSNLKEMIKNSTIAAEEGINNNQQITKFDPQKDYYQPERNMFILHELNKAIKDHHLSLHYQPIISLTTNKAVSYEALARWNHPTLGAIEPKEFISIAEKTLLINPYTEWLINESFKQLVQWQKQYKNLILSINFSMKNLEDHRLIDQLLLKIKQYKISPHNVKIEITETAVAQNIDKIAEILQSLKQQKLGIVIDDFGTGQSSLDYLLKLPLDEIKIDQSFIKSMLNNSASEAIIRSAITMANELHLGVTAEGIETKEQIQHLQKLGCHYGQGYLIAKPMPSDMAASWLESNWKQKSVKL